MSDSSSPFQEPAFEAPAFEESEFEDSEFEDSEFEETVVAVSAGDEPGNGLTGGKARAVLEHVATSIVDEKDAVVVDVSESRGGVKLSLHVAPSDMGRVIGKRGRVAQALRTLVLLPPLATAPTPLSTSSTDHGPGVPVALLEIGWIARPHGLTGEVVVGLVSNVADRLHPGAQLTVLSGTADDQRQAARRELEIIAVRPHQGRYLVRFSGVTTRELADTLRGAVLGAAPVEDADAYFVHDLIGSTVHDLDGTVRGTVTAVEANPASDLLVVDDRFYVPLRFVVEREGQRLVIDAPDGLFE